MKLGADRERADLPLPADEIATTLLCLGVGLGLFRSIDPHIPVTALVDVMRLFARDKRA